MGEIDLYAAPTFKEQIIQAIDEGCTALVVDLSEMRFFDSTTAGVLVGAFKRIHNRGGRMTLARPRPELARFFKITGLDRVFETYDSLEEALERAREPL